mmetsp:Transcript_34008/g.97996  ORF Transcript_34008/g.97996 Transcript_34008/m.97996 type:complete len:325 (+) Transcript_34008:65-1039(+)
MVAGRLAAALLPLASCGRLTLTTTTAPSIASGIAADLLVRTATDCDLLAAWRVLAGSAFRPDWLTATGATSGMAPLPAAMRTGCGEIVALLVTHPSFDRSTIRRERQRRELGSAALDSTDADPDSVLWAITVMEQAYMSKIREDELGHDMWLAIVDEVWYLPKKGEWFPPSDLSMFNISSELRPEFPIDLLHDFIVSDDFMITLTNAAGGETPLPNANLQIDAIVRLWRLVVHYLQLPEDCDQRHAISREIRSIGWSLFFRGSKDALMVHFLVFDFLATQLEEKDIPVDEEGKHEDSKGGALGAYKRMAIILENSWDKLGTWIA